jgi:lysozyme
MPIKPIVIDLSHYQVIPHDLNDTRAAGIEAVIHKATEGLKNVDSKFNARYSLARDAGMLFGAYHFLHSGQITQQADKFLQIVEGCCPLDKTLLVCDFEQEGLHLYEALTFLKYVERQSGQKPVLYAGSLLKDQGGAAACPELLEYRLWLAQYTRKPFPTLPKGYEHKGWWLWQYTQTGTIAGVDGKVDLNTYDGDAEALRNDWVIPTSVAGSGVSNQEQGGDDSANSTSNGPSVPDPSPTPVVVEKDVTIGFFQKIKLRLTAWLTAIGGLTGIQQYKDQLTDIGLPGWALIYLLLGAAILFVIWLIYEGIAHLVGIWSRRSLTNALVKANATPENTVIVACPDDLDKYASLGYKVVRRQ